MSVNITSYAYSTTSSRSRNFLMDDERINKAEYEKRKKLRLQQVRQQSKEMAYQARRKAESEKNKLIDQIKKTKANELNAWREKVISLKQEEYKSNLNKFGEAHIAAACETNLQKAKFEREKFGNLSKKRTPLSQYNKQTKLTSSNKNLHPAQNIKSNVDIRRSEINDENSSNAAIQQKHVTSTVVHNTSPSQRNLYPRVYVRDTVVDDSSFSSLYNDNEDDYHNKEHESVLESSKTLGRNYQYELDSEYDLRLQNVDEQRHAKNNFIPSIREENGNKNKFDIYDPKDYHATDTSSESALVELPIPKSQTLPFTQISDLIRKRQEFSEDKNNIDSIMKPISSKFQQGINKKPAVSYTDWQKASGKVFDIIHEPSILPNALKTVTTSMRKSQLKPTSETKKIQPTRSSPIKMPNKQKPVLEPTDRVQYYDYFNRFEKQYNPTDLNIVKNDKLPNRLNAIQEAKIETRVKVAQQKNLEELKKKVNERSQRALEKEQTRRDYEELTAKLDALIKQKNVSEIGQQNINSLNSRVKPQISKNLNQKELRPEEQPQQQQPTAGGQAVLISSSKNDDILMNDNNSSDSCASILLNYVNHRSKQVAQDIITCDNTNKLDKLKELLVRINQIREELLHEVKKISQQQQEIVVQKVVDAIDNIEKERLKIIAEKPVKESIRNEFQKKEKDLIRREKILERKLQDLYKKEKKEKKIIENESSSKDDDYDDGRSEDTSTVVLEERMTNKPVKIVIQLNENIRRKYPKSPYKSPRKRSSSLSCRPIRLKKTPTISKEIISSVPVEKAVQVSLPSPKIQDERINSIPESTSSTSYRSPPNNIQSKLTAYLEHSEPKEIIPDTVKLKTVQNVPDKTRDKKTQTKTEIKIDKKKIEDEPRKKQPSNPILMQYIKRLLGMSRNSIEMLGVSSSEVDTPSASVVNASGNFSTTDSEILQQTQIERLNKFINDNYSFLNEMEESILNEKSLTLSNNSSMKTIEAIWKETLRKQEQKMRKEKEEKRQKQLKELRPILKLSNKPKKSVKDARQQTEDISPPSDDKMLLVSKYTELTDNCTQRIAELTEMINKVRKEKQKILEITLSSGTETFPNSTEYMDFADRHTHESAGGGTQDSSKISDPKPADSIVPLEKNKLTGMSRDSGISLSRPITSLDIRDSPDIRYIEKPMEDHQNESTFVPILKDIPKLPPRFAQTDNVITTEFCSLVPSSQNEDFDDKSKKTKPPVSLSRYSPQLVEEIPHELSTIFEVDTPVTSRLNASFNDHNIIPSIIEQERLKYNELKGKKFLTFEEYAHQHNLNITKFDPEASSKLTIENQSVNNTLTEKDNQLEHHPQEPSSESIPIKENDEYQILPYKKFPTCAEYMEKIGVTSILDSRTLEGISEISENKDTQSVSSTESLIDVVAELKRRKIIQNSFDNDSFDTSENKSSEKSHHTESVNDVQVITDDSENVHSKNKKDDDDHDVQKSDDALKRKLLEDCQSDDIGKDLDKMGLKWASLMLKKSRQQQDKGSSTSSSIGYISRKRSPKKPMNKSKDKLSGIHSLGDESQGDTNDLTPDSHAGGQPLNLREFLAKELEKHTSTSAISSTDDSLASQFLRSLLSCSSNTTPKLQNKDKATQDRQRTSTPVLTKSSNSKSNSSDEKSSNLFSAESRISSVRFSSSSASSDVKDKR